MRKEDINLDKQKEGLWFILEKNLVFINNSGEMLGLPDGIKPNYFSIRNLSNYKNYNYYSIKEYKTIKDAIKEVYQKLRNKKIDYKYSIYLHYKNKNSDYPHHILVTTATKKENDIEFNYNNLHEYNWHHEDKLSIDTINALKSIPIPSEWKVSYRKDSEIESLISILKNKYNFKDVLIKKQLTREKKIEFLKSIITYLSTMEGLVDFNKMKQPTLIYRDIKKWGGLYSNYKGEIAINQISSFYHEYFHHIDFATLYRRRETEVEDLYDEVAEDLTDDKTLTSFISRYKDVLNEQGNVKNYNDKRSKHYIYWISYHEILARFFSDYMLYYFGSELPKKLSVVQRHFTDEEIKNHKEKFEAYLQKTFSLKVKENEHKSFFY